MTMRRHYTGYSNLIAWKAVQSDHRFSIVYSPNAMLFTAIPIWWGALFVFCFLFYHYAPAPFGIFVIPLGIATAALQAIIVGYRLHQEKRRGDYLHLDFDAKTIELPRSFTNATWKDRPPAFYINRFDMGEWVYEFNVELDDGRCFPILHSIDPAFGRIASKLAKHGFVVQKRFHKDG